MDWQSLTPFFVMFGLLFLMRQRADPTNRQAVRRFFTFSVSLIGLYAWWNEVLGVAIVAFLAAQVFSAVFWLLVGRYNPASSSDDIRVLGLDD